MIQDIIKIAESAGLILMKYYSTNLEIKTKINEFDFVTKADIKADKYIRTELKKLFPKDLILSEESNNIPENFSGNVWMVDPLDGTKDFINKGTGFSVMIGLCKNGIPILGVVYAPAKELLYYAEKYKGSFLKTKNKITKLSVNNISKISESKIVTRFIHGEQRDSDLMINALPTLKQIPSSSVGINLGLICKQKAEIYIFTNTRGSKWDTCAPQIILEEAGGKITDYNGNSLNYKQKELKWKNLFIATNSNLHNKVLEHIKNYNKLNKDKLN